jgi:cysteine-rich repeat protein
MSCSLSTTFCIALSCCALCATACDAYERQLIGSSRAASDAGGRDAGAREAGSDAALDASASPDADADAAPSSADGGSPEEPFDPSLCSGGECWWSTLEGEGQCQSAGAPTDDARPAASVDGSSTEPDLYFGLAKVRVGTTNREGKVADDGWQDFGLDLDGVCTNSSTCPASERISCRSSTAALPFDGQLCRDNTLARLQPVVAEVPEIGERYGLSENVFNCALWRGSYNYVVRVSGYNGERDDSQVRVDFYRSSGLEEQLPWQCKPDQTDFRERYPRWRSSLSWRVDEADLTAPIEKDGAWPDGRIADADAYVKDGYLVAQLPEGASVGFIGDGSPHRGFVLRTAHGHLLGRLQHEQDGTWSLVDGLLAGRIRNEDLILAFREVGFCEEGSLSRFYASMVSYVEENADVLASGESISELPCDAMSYAIGFEAAQITPGSSAFVPPRVECCPPGNTLEQCSAKCGDGKVSGDETCDSAIAAGGEGACPTACEGGEPCAPLALQGSDCQVACAPQPISALVANDACCPPGANAQTDGDCGPVCGNGVLEGSETCDPPSACPSCTSDNACLAQTTMGSAETCDVRCTSAPISACEAGDACCPSDCSSRSDSSRHDSDCSTTCGNGTIEANETCEAGSERPCPPSCDDRDACTKDEQTGSAENCNVRCQHIAITEAINSDRCCPTGINSNTDNDCLSSCGNRVVEAGEQCDDGNDVAGDGCSLCSTESSEQQCLARLGETTACAMCTCSKCTSQTLVCQGDDDVEDAKLCEDMVDCARETGCRADACYCGSAGLLTCLTSPAGACRRQVAAAAKTDSALDIQARQGDPAYPIQRAIALGECVDDNCSAECL